MTTKGLRWQLEFSDIDEFLEQRERLKKLLMKFCAKHEKLEYNMESETKNSLYTIDLMVVSHSLTDGDIIGELI